MRPRVVIHSRTTEAFNPAEIVAAGGKADLVDETGAVVGEITCTKLDRTNAEGKEMYATVFLYAVDFGGDYADGLT